MFLSSHVLDEVEALADRVGIVRQGHLVAVERVADLKERAVRTVEIRFASPVDASAFEDLPGVEQARVSDSVGHFVVAGSMDALVKAAAAFEVVTVTSGQPDLEDVFLAYYGQGR